MPGLRHGPMRRSESPSGASIFTTSAPSSASNRVADGPITTVVRSSTRTPASGPPTARAGAGQCGGLSMPDR